MSVNTNSWNRIRYTLYRPIYDVIERLFESARKQSIDGVNIHPNDKVLILGAGTGLDLPYLPPSKELHAVDITASMIEELKNKAKTQNIAVDARVMDGQNLDYAESSFDVVILHLIVAVIPDPVKCMQEVERVLKPGGRFTVMDKFIPAGQSPSILRKLVNPITNLLFSDITREIDAILAHTNLIKESDQYLKASFRIIKGKK